jgi:hypothetical protein
VPARLHRIDPQAPRAQQVEACGEQVRRGRPCRVHDRHPVAGPQRRWPDADHRRVPCAASQPLPGTIQKPSALYLLKTPNNTSKEDGMTPTRFTSAVRRALRALDAWTLDVFNPRYPTPRD